MTISVVSNTSSHSRSAAGTSTPDPDLVLVQKCESFEFIVPSCKCHVP